MRQLDATNYIYTVYRVSALYGCAFGRGEETVLNEKKTKKTKQTKHVKLKCNMRRTCKIRTIVLFVHGKKECWTCIDGCLQYSRSIRR